MGCCTNDDDEDENVCFDFHYNFVWNSYHSKNNSATYYHKRT
jgi:hypothetical protein